MAYYRAYIDLYKIRTELELTLEQVRKKTGISIGYLSKLELGTKRNCSIDVAASIAIGLGVPLDKVIKYC